MVGSAFRRILWHISSLQYHRPKLLYGLAALVEPLLARAREAATELRILGALRDTLLPKLISGELRVKHGEKFIGNLV